jgi:CRISPR-associated endonuclease Cas2
MKVVVAYDVSDDDARRKVASLLADLLTRVQYSVFEGAPPPGLLAAKLKAALSLIDPSTDRLRVYYLCGACAGRVDAYGAGPVEEPPVRVL